MTDKPGMTTIAQSNSAREGLILPDDLSVYIGKKTLVKLILDSIEGLNTPESGCGVSATVGPGFQPAMMLTLLTYCYATGVYAATDIEISMQQDQMVRYLCAKNYLNLPGLLEFRRYSRDRIKECLASVLRRVWELRFCDEDACLRAGASYMEANIGRWLNMRPSPDFMAEAERRIVRAVRADSMAMDW
jgi:transposase